MGLEAAVAPQQIPNLACPGHLDLRDLLASNWLSRSSYVDRQRLGHTLDRHVQYLVHCKKTLERLLGSISRQMDADLSIDEAEVVERQIRFARHISDQLAKLDPAYLTDCRPLLAQAAYYGALLAGRANPNGPLAPEQLQLAETAVRYHPLAAEYEDLFARLRERSPPPQARRPRQQTLEANIKPRTIGYLVKRTEGREDIPFGAVEEVCSVSCCISTAPAGQPLRGMGFHPSECVALSDAEHSTDRSCDLYAYRLLPVAFGEDGEMRDLDEEERDALAAAEENVEPIPPDYICLGWDITNNSLGWKNWPQFECSPLTCNGLAEQIATTRYGLIEELDRALTLTPEVIKGPSEAGVYYVVQVWRKRRSNKLHHQPCLS